MMIGCSSLGRQDGEVDFGYYNECRLDAILPKLADKSRRLAVHAATASMLARRNFTGADARRLRRFGLRTTSTER